MNNRLLITANAQKRLSWKVMWSLAFTALLFYISIGNRMGLPLPSVLSSHGSANTYALFQLLLTVLVIILGKQFYVVGCSSLMKNKPNVDSLIAIGTLSAFIYSVYGVWCIIGGKKESTHGLYFVYVAITITLSIYGEYMDFVSNKDMEQAVKRLIGVSSKTVCVVRNAMKQVVDIQQVVVGEILLIKPGEMFPMDGVVIDGLSCADEFMINGKSIPVEKRPGDKIYGTTVNGKGQIKYQVTKAGEDCTFTHTMQQVKEVQEANEQLIDKIARRFVFFIAFLSVATALIWLVSGASLSFSIHIFFSILMIACPCTLGLVAPINTKIARKIAEAKGILVKNKLAFESAYKTQVLVLDKSGTITKGIPSVTDIRPLIRITRDKLLQMAASAEQGLERPLSVAIVNAAEDKNVELLERTEFTVYPGYGIQAIIEEKVILVGNEKYMKKNGYVIKEAMEIAREYEQEGKLPLFVVLQKQISGIICVADTVKESSKQAIEKFNKQGMEVVMVTGDNGNTAMAIGKEVGIQNIKSEMLPEAKVSTVKEIMKQGKKVALVGDGTNDAPAMRLAHIGIAIGSGTNTAIQSSDIVLNSSELTDVVYVFSLSRKMSVLSKWNVIWCGIYNVLAFPIAMGISCIFGGPVLTPVLVAACMIFSILSLGINALWTLRFKK
ncbi:MAG: heavy metal translocating P-type ATPase [Clostridium sp.]|nr:heavy metal translocating P-type ATPase [Clostridium sp.]